MNRMNSEQFGVAGDGDSNAPVWQQLLPMTSSGAVRIDMPTDRESSSSMEAGSPSSGLGEESAAESGAGQNDSVKRSWMHFPRSWSLNHSSVQRASRPRAFRHQLSTASSIMSNEVAECGGLPKPPGSPEGNACGLTDDESRSRPSTPLMR